MFKTFSSFNVLRFHTQYWRVYELLKTISISFVRSNDQDKIIRSRHWIIIIIISTIEISSIIIQLSRSSVYAEDRILSKESYNCVEISRPKICSLANH